MCPPRETPTPPTPNDDLLATFLALDTPPGYRAELIDQEITVVPPPNGEHEEIISVVAAYIIASAGRSRWTVAANKGLITPRGRFIPDLTIAPRGSFRKADPWAPCTDVELVAEITSGNAEHDRHAKRFGYAQAGIPLYLLVDRDLEVAVLFSHPDGDDYRTTDTAPFGKSLTLPKPFGLTINTGEFV